MSGIGRAAGAAEKLGYIGLGLMGMPMTRRLLAAGHAVTIWNRSPGKTATLVEAGATSAKSVRGLAAKADIIFMCVTDAAAVSELVFGRDGLADEPGEGKLVVDFSSIHPDATRAIAKRLKEANGMGGSTRQFPGAPRGRRKARWR